MTKKISKNQTITDPMQHFRQQVYYWVKQIPEGRVTSYGAIAKLAGFPRHARHVSKALGAADKHLKLPWFRVIGGNGKIAFDSDSDAFAKQQYLLEKENIKVNKGKVDLKIFAWQPHENTCKSKSSDSLSAEDFFK